VLFLFFYFLLAGAPRRISRGALFAAPGAPPHIPLRLRRNALSIDLANRIGNNGSVYSDSHLHLVDLEEREPDFYLRLPSNAWVGAVASHDIAEFESSERLRTLLPPTIPGFGIHPQGLRDDTAEFLSGLAHGGRIGFIGEAGFDFFGDKPERIRNEKNLSAQRKAFEFQLNLAIKTSMPLLIHSRKAMDLLMGYRSRLKRLKSVIFHGWPGRLMEAMTLLESGVPAYFSFGTTLLRDAKHALETCAGIPSDRILSETDAPWQPPRGEPWTGLGAIVRVADAIASVREMPEEPTLEMLRANFAAAFGADIQTSSLARKIND
jgi:TatD DNase family protein